MSVNHLARRTIRLLIGALILAPIGAAAGSNDTYLGIDAGYLNGDFGGDITSELYSLKFTGGVIAPAYDISVSLPLTQLEDDSGYSESGIGDLLLSYGHLLHEGDDHGLTVHGTLMLKYPTAGEDKGLGTGEGDYGIDVNLGKRWSSFRGSMHAGYTVNGDPPAVDYNNTASYGAAIYKIVNRIGSYSALEGQTSTVDGTDKPLELQLGVFYATNYQHMLVGNMTIGLSNGSPDFGFSIGVRRWMND